MSETGAWAHCNPAALTLGSVAVARKRGDYLIMLASTTLPDRVAIDTLRLDDYRALSLAKAAMNK